VALREKRLGSPAAGKSEAIPDGDMEMEDAPLEEEQSAEMSLPLRLANVE
jgi:hypothetical protein